MANESGQKNPAQLGGVDLRASAKALPLGSGLYLFTVTGAAPIAVVEAGDMQFPALHVAPGPGCPANLVEFVGVARSIGMWLYRPGDKLLVKVDNPGATLILSSVRAAGTQPLDVRVEKLDGAAANTTGATAAAPPGDASPPRESLKLELGLHIRNRGDLTFPGASWAGLLAENLWIEALSIVPQETLSPRDLEYKGLSANGFETPWLSDGAVCGTKGLSTPLIGFAIRLKSDVAATYDCEYSGYFQSGITIGPLRNGVPCRSKTATDPLVGVLLRIVTRATAVRPAAAEAGKPALAAQGPRFSKFREAIKAVSTGRGTRARSAKVTEKTSSPDRPARKK